jgi:ATP-dependent RNA helicase DeaD
LDWLDKEDLIKRLISLEFNRLIDYYQEAGDIESPQEERRRQEKGGNYERGGNPERRGFGKGTGTGRFSERGYARLFINVGKMDGLNPQNLIGLLNDNVSGRKVDIGRIDLMKNFSFFEVKEADKDRVIQNIDGLKAFRRVVAVEQAQETPSDDRKKKIERKDNGYRSTGGGYSRAKSEGYKAKGEGYKSKGDDYKAKKSEGKNKGKRREPRAKPY